MKCQRCGTRNNLTTHHIYFPRRKFNRSKKQYRNATVKLCTKCHKASNKLYRLCLKHGCMGFNEFEACQWCWWGLGLPDIRRSCE